MDIELEKEREERELLNSDYIEPDEYGRSGYVIDYGDDPACGAPWGVRTVTLELPDGTILPAYRSKKNMKEFEPKILGFCCNWCAYAGADLAGISRMQYPPNIRMIRVMCSGTVDPLFIFEALSKGADGVFIGGCHPGDCHYQSGNYKTRRKIALVKRLLSQLGLDPRRVRLEWVSAAEGGRFAQVVGDFVEEIKTLGPNPLVVHQGLLDR